MLSFKPLIAPGQALPYIHGKTRIFLCLHVLFIAQTIFGQASNALPQVYSSFDRLIGEQNMDLFNGPLYIEAFDQSPNSHPYFIEEGFTSGHLVFEGQPYFNQNLRYNTFLDELIITPKHSSSGLEVMLLKEKVNEFSIKGHRFIRPDLSAPGEHPGFLEVLSEKGQAMLLKKHRKKKNKAQQGDVIINKFTEDIDYYIYTSGNLTKANRRSQWKRIFPDQKKEINNLYRSLRKTRKTDNDSFFNLLFPELN